MKAALLSELITSKNVLIQSLAIYAAVSLVIGISMQSPIAMVACIGAMTPFMMTFTFCALDGMNGWERFRSTLPVSRTAIVASRYASILLATVAMVLTAWCIGMLLSAALPALFPDWAVSAAFAQEASDPAVFLFAGMMGSGLMLAVAAFVLPFAMRFGMTKSIRIIPVFAVMLIPVSIFFRAAGSRYGSIGCGCIALGRSACCARLGAIRRDRARDLRGKLRCNGGPLPQKGGLKVTRGGVALGPRVRSNPRRIASRASVL